MEALKIRDGVICLLVLHYCWKFGSGFVHAWLLYINIFPFFQSTHTHAFGIHINTLHTYKDWIIR